METCGQNCLKYLLFVFNFLFFLCGGALLGLGIWAVVDGASFSMIIASNAIIFNALYIIIAVGAALLVISFLGCCGAIKENRCLLGTFFAIVLIIFIVEIVGAVLVFAFYPQVEGLVQQSMNKYVENNNQSIITQGWNTLQAGFGCCGFNQKTNWANSTWMPSEPGRPFPLSCCTRDRFSLNGRIINETLCLAMVPNNYYSIGCETKVKQYYWAVGGTGLGVLLVELLAMIFACCLYRAIEED